MGPCDAEAPVCDPATGFCEASALPDGSVCDPAAKCSAAGHCSGGLCVDAEPAPAAAAGFAFTDVSQAANVVWNSWSPSTLEAGGAFVDLDGDALPDLLLTAFGTAAAAPHVAALLNQGDGSFEDRTEPLGLASVTSPLTGVAAADIDNDGDQDLVLTARTGTRLYRNDGAAGFVDVSVSSGVADGAWSTAAAFGDFDQDGLVDLYLGHYILIANYPYHTGWPNRLLHNLGGGVFEDVTEVSGTAGAGATLAALFSDVDDDGDLDLLVCNDHGAFVEPDRVYRNDGPGAAGTVFTEVSAALGADQAIYCMGIASGDLDGDLRLDYYLTNLGANRLLLGGEGALTESAGPLGVALAAEPCPPHLLLTGWGVGMHDLDRDGRLDLFVSQGYVPADATIANAEFQALGILARAPGATEFVDVAPWLGLGEVSGRGRGAAFADYDGDGDLDVLQMYANGPARLLRNDGGVGAGWVGLRLRGRLGARDAIGARVWVRAGGVERLREAQGQGSFGSSSPLDVHVGLGASHEVERVRIRWPSGMWQELYGVAADAWHELVEPTVSIEGVAVGSGGTGAAAWLEVTVHNHGAAAAQAALSVRYAPQGPADGLPVLAPLAPGQTQLLSVSLPAPPTGEPPSVIVRVEDASGAADEREVPLSPP
ncbi:MAG: CRTAC1 family protein [Deltaproteobacteria bacterium]|nr:CRTAC1 family protein [Deltaproteobacteria bacterium]